MKTLICSLQPSQLSLPKSFPWNPTLRHEIGETLTQPAPTWKLHAHANAKGFNNNGESGEEDEPLPRVVFNRMIVRTLVSVGAPLVIGVGLLNLLGLVKNHSLWDVPVWLSFLTTLLTSGASASWDCLLQLVC